MSSAAVDDLVVRNLYKSYGRVPAAVSINFNVQAGEIVGLLGPNGAGKTTIVESITGLVEPNAGRVEVCGIDTKANPAGAKQKIGAVLQSTTLQDKITPAEALKVFGSLYADATDHGALLRRFGLEDKANTSFASLSGGQKQRVALALACVGKPQLFLLDEPTANLDPLIRHEFHVWIRELKKEGRSVLLATHDMEEAEQLCDRVVVIDRGRIVADGTPQQLIAETSNTMRVSLQTLPSFQPAWANGITDISMEAQTATFTTSATEIKPVLVKLLAALDKHGAELIDLRVFKATLEDVIRKLTGPKTQ